MLPNFVKPQDFPGLSVPEWLLHRSEVSPGAKILYAYLAAHTCAPDLEEFFVASGLHQRKIANGLGASQRSIRNWLRELEGNGLIRCDPGGWGKCSLYFFPAHRWQKNLQ
jgi:hypothetical protein